MSRLHHLLTWIAAALLMAAWMYAAAHFDHERAALEAEQVTAARHSREWVAAQVCAQNGGYRWVSDTDLQCLTKRGNKTGTVSAVGGEK